MVRFQSPNIENVSEKSLNGATFQTRVFIGKSLDFLPDKSDDRGTRRRIYGTCCWTSRISGISEDAECCSLCQSVQRKDAMLHSLSAQVSYYSRMIQQHPGWKYCGVYADEAITGTKDSREQFQKLLERCRNGEIDLILTKSVSRFARNTITLLETVRELKLLGLMFISRSRTFTPWVPMATDAHDFGILRTGGKFL